MKAKDLLLLIGGVIVGVLLGVVVMSGLRPDQSAQIAQLESQVKELQNAQSVAAAPTPVFRTVNEAAATSSFYLVTFDKTVEWLEETLELELTEEQKEALTAISEGILDEIALEEAFEDKESPVYVTLQYIYEQLVIKRGDQSESPIASCLALENDFYTGTVQYLYLQVPSDAKEMGIPKDWKLLDSPLPNTQTWVSVCFEPDMVEEETESTTSGS